MRIIVCGCRDWTDWEALKVALGCAFGGVGTKEQHAQFGDCIAHGGCPTGADAMAKRFCKEFHVFEQEHPADWDRFGRYAGPRRNEEMAEEGAELCLAFWDGKSVGTLDMIKRATSHRIPVRIIPR